MTQPNLLDIVPEYLFETYFISDIDHVQKQLQYEIERKREELRAMVGERYRDLIHAADTIEEMKVTTASTFNHISEMMIACRKLHDTHLVGFKVDDKPAHPSSFHFTTNPDHSIALQVKLLMELPEKIWTCIEAEDYVKATQLFIMGRHVNTGLQLQVGGKDVKPNMQSIQRLVQQHWNYISNFNQTITNVCSQKLQDVDINIEVACSCLVSIYILDCQTMVELLNTLIGLHSNSSLKATLQFDLTQILEGDTKAQIKKKIVNAVKIVLKTVALVYSCFIENNGGAVLAELRNLYSRDAAPLIELVQFSDPAALKLLPSVISNYRLPLNKEIQALAKQEITQCVQKWSVWVKSFIDENVHTLLQNVNRIKVLHEIREEAFKVETPLNWSKICESVDLPEVHVWCHYFQPLLTSRVKAIIDNRWMKVYDTYKTQVLVDLTKVSSENELEKEADINWFVWKDLIGETIIESRNDVIKVMNSLMKGMSLQDRGFTPILESLCNSLDNELQKLLEDLKVYLQRDKKITTNTAKILFNYEDEDDTEQMYGDKAEVEKFLREVSDKNIESIIRYIKLCFEEPTLQSTELQKKTTAIYLARFTQAITTLMPHLRKCYVSDDPSAFSIIDLDRDALKSWVDMCESLKENCLYCWGKWVDIVLSDADLTKGLPQEFTLEANIDYLMMQWDEIKIEEKDDEGNAIESTIKVPAGPSLKLQEYLYSISRILDEVVPHTLPIEIHTMFIERVANITLTHYDKIIREKGTDINQRCALQLLMDVRHLTMLMVVRENKKLMEFSQEICESLRQKIDPFDYDVFYPYIQTNLKRSVQRVQTLLGSMILHHGQLNGIIGTKPVLSGGTGDKAASLLAAGDSHWFSLLPVATPPTQHKKQEKPVKRKAAATASPSKPRSDISDIMTSSLPINFATAKSGAASFFNSMTSDWFSGS